MLTSPLRPLSNETVEWEEITEAGRSADRPLRRDEELEGSASDDSIEAGAGGGDGSFPGDPDDGEGDDSTIDGKPIEPDQGDGVANELRSIEVAKAPKNNAFNSALIVSNDLPNRSDRNDSFQGTDQDEKLHGRRGKDTLLGGGGNDYLFGGPNHDLLSGQNGDDVLEGNKGNDLLNGGRGDDVLFGDFGEDTLTGGKGDDVFILSSDKDVITDFNVEEDAIGLVYALDLSFSQKGDDLLIKGDDGVRTLLQGVDKDDFLANYPDYLQIVPAINVDVI